MPDSIERTIYKLEIDDTAYTKGVDSAAASTQRFAKSQEEANKRLAENEAQLKKQAEQVEKAKKSLDSYTGSDTSRRKELEKTFQAEKQAYDTINKLTADIRKGYESAKKAADDFNATAAKASSLGPGKIPGAAPIVPPVIPQVKFQDFDLKDILSATTVEFDKLRIAIDAAEKELSQLNEESEEFKQLKPLVDQGKKALEDFDAATKAAAGSQSSIREQLRRGREELVRLEQAGKGATEQYFTLEKQVARLTDQFRDQQQRIRILASDTKLLDFGKAGITAATSAFQGFTAIQVLAGDESAELQKKTMQLFAAMQLLQSIEQLSNLTRREGILATLAQSGAQSVYTAVVGASTGALKAFRIALLGTGIGVAIAALGFLIVKYQQLKDATEKANEKAKLFKEINEEAIKGFTEQVTKLELIRTKLNDLNIPQQERIKLAKEYNKTADESAKIDIKQIDNIDLLNQAIDRNIAQIKKRAFATAAEAVLAKRAGDVFLEQEKAKERAQKQVAAQTPTGAPETRVSIDEQTGKLIQRIVTEEEKIAALIRNDPKLKEAQKKFDDTLKEIGAQINIADIIEITGGGSEIQNVFEQEKANLEAQLSELQRSAEESIKKINDSFADKLIKERLRIQKLVKDKKVTPEQGAELISLAVQVNQTALGNALADFNKRITDARKKLNDELNDLQQKNSQDQLNLIQDEFTRRAALIEFNEKKELEDSKQATDERLAALELDKLLLGEKTYQDAKAQIISAGEQTALIILQRFAQQRQDLAAESFRKILDSYQVAISTADLIRDEGVANQIRNVSDRFLAGKISYETFQKEITKIQRDNEAIRRNATLATQRNELAELDRHIAAIVDKTSKEYKDLIKLRDELRAKIATGEKEDAEKDAAEANIEDPRIKRIVAITEATGQLADSVIGFWQKANEAETKALDRSIALQEKRVEAARRIADRGNAEYLKAEEDRLNELQIKRENAARRQLAIDAALQASQLLVAITGAVAKIATPGIGIAETIGAIAVIIGSLATGYGLVKSLQGNQPKLAKGDPFVRREGHPAGVDTIPAWLNEGEAVIPTDTNRAYHPAVKAIYHKTIPAEDINQFVLNYHKLGNIPRSNTERIKNATAASVESSGKMAGLINEQNKKLDENNELLRESNRLLKQNKIDVHYDAEGLAVHQMEIMERNRINKKA